MLGSSKNTLKVGSLLSAKIRLYKRWNFLNSCPLLFYYLLLGLYDYTYHYLNQPKILCCANKSMLLMSLNRQGTIQQRNVLCITCHSWEDFQTDRDYCLENRMSNKEMTKILAQTIDRCVLSTQPRIVVKSEEKETQGSFRDIIWNTDFSCIESAILLVD